MNEAKVVRLERRLAQVEAIAAGLREQIAALQVVPAPEPKPVRKATKRTAKKATG